MSHWFYFGCDERVGHYLFGEHMGSGCVGLDYGLRDALTCFDGRLCPPACEGLYRASLTRLGALGFSALAFWDCTVDRRGGSNSIFFALDLSIGPDGIMLGALRFFPTVIRRLPNIDLSLARAQFKAMQAR